MIWVVVQMILFGLYVFVPDSSRFEAAESLKLIGAALALLGFSLGTKAVYDLRKSLAVSPVPAVNSSLIQNGIYRFIRHPMYTSVWLVVWGYALYAGSVTKVVLSTVLVAFFVAKSRHEERLLHDRYDDYGDYSKQVGAFWPKIKK